MLTLESGLSKHSLNYFKKNNTVAVIFKNRQATGYDVHKISVINMSETGNTWPYGNWWGNGQGRKLNLL